MKIPELFKTLNATLPVSIEEVQEFIPAELNVDLKDVYLAEHLNAYLEALVIALRGPSEKNPTPFAGLSKDLDNNAVLKKLRIAFELQADALDVIFLNAGLDLSKHEISALFRKKDHKHFKKLDDTKLLAFFKGLEISIKQGNGS
jgi:uncharacterized protein YehS (DUF1456 family)